MKALRFYDKGDIRLDDVPAPKCGKDEVRLKIAYCGICGTDLHEYSAGPLFTPAKGERHPTSGAELPVTLGHEMSGTIVEIGKDVKGLSVGQNVTVNVALDDRHYGKATCDLCNTGCTNLCRSIAFYGVNAPGGGFAEEIVVKPYALFPVPQTVPLKLAALAEPLAVASHMVRISGFQRGQTVLVLGAGPIGCALTFLLRARGASKIIVSEISAARAARAKEFGADLVVNPLDEAAGGSDSVEAAVEKHATGGVDISFDACGLQTTLDTAIARTRPGGTIFNVAIHDKPLQLHMNALTFWEKKLMAGNAYTRQDFEDVIEILATRGQEAAKLITSIVPLANIVEEGFKELINNMDKHVKILIAAGGSDA